MYKGEDKREKDDVKQNKMKGMEGKSDEREGAGDVAERYEGEEQGDERRGR